MIATAKQLLKDFVGLIYPNLCPGCGRPLNKYEDCLCIGCKHSLAFTSLEADEFNEAEKMLWGKYPIERGGTYCKFTKGGISQHILHDFKYNGNKRLAVEMGKYMGKSLLKSGILADYILPVPLHKKKLKKRGYNQSELLAEGMSQICGIEVAKDVLYRAKYKTSQTKKDMLERWQNSIGIYEIRPEKAAALKGKRLLIVDDVITTGATIEACCHALEKIENVKLSFYCFAYA